MTDFCYKTYKKSLEIPSGNQQLGSRSGLAFCYQQMTGSKLALF